MLVKGSLQVYEYYSTEKDELDLLLADSAKLRIVETNGIFDIEFKYHTSNESSTFEIIGHYTGEIEIVKLQ